MAIFQKLYTLYICKREKQKRGQRDMMNATNPFANYTLAIATQYEDTRTAIHEAEKKPPRKIYRSLDSMLEECVFLGATRFGNNFIA